MEVLCSLDRVMSSPECVSYACDPSVYLDVPYIGCVCIHCMSEVISSFRSLRASSQVFYLPILFLCVILHTMWSSKSGIAMHLTLWYIVFVCHQNYACESSIGSVYVGGY